MSSREPQAQAEFPYPRDNVFRAVLVAVDNLPGMHIDAQDAANGDIMVGVGLSPGTEAKLPLSVQATGPGSARLSITPGATPHGGLEPGRSFAAVERIARATAEALSAFPDVKP